MRVAAACRSSLLVKEKTMKEQINEPQGAPRPGNGNQRLGRLPERTQEAADRAREAAIEKVESVRDRTREGIDQSRQQVADRIRRLGSALRSASDALHDEDRTVARYAELASEKIEQAAGYIGSADVRRTMRDVEGFARRQPALFFGGAFLLGLAAGRFLKSSQQRSGDRYRFEHSDSSERITATDWPAATPKRSMPGPETPGPETGGVFDTDPLPGGSRGPVT
jgi:hypothetical protein